MDSIICLSEYIDKINRIKTESNFDKHETSSISFFYRGQCNDYMPLPSVFRDELMQKEDYLYHELLLRCPESFKGMSHLDILVMMQHYGLPTRLLDVSLNPLVALYFACKNYNKNNKIDEGYIYIYAANADETVYSDDNRVQILSCLPPFSSNDKSKMYKEMMDSLEYERFDKTTRGKYTAPIERLHNEISKEIPAFPREMKPLDLYSPLFVKPLMSNDRIVRQDGAFIISGLCINRKEAEKKIQSYCIGMLRIENRTTILKELDSVGINEASLFPEVDRVAYYLKEKCKAKSIIAL